MRLTPEAQAWEQEKDGQLCLLILHDFLDGLERDIRTVLSERGVR